MIGAIDSIHGELVTKWMTDSDAHMKWVESSYGIPELGHRGQKVGKSPAASVCLLNNNHYPTLVTKTPDVASSSIVMTDEETGERAEKLAAQALDSITSGRVEVLVYPSPPRACDPY